MAVGHLEYRGSRGYISSGSVEGFVHRLGKDARRELVRIAVEAAGGVKRLAERVGVSRQAVHEFLSGRTHPRDEVVVRVFWVIAGSAPYYRRRALEVLRGEMEEVVRGFSAAMELLGSPGPGLEWFLEG